MLAPSRSLRYLLTIAGIGWLGLAGSISAQPRENRPVDLPQGPAMPGFDIERFSNAGNGWFETFYVEEMTPLRRTLDAGMIAADTRVLVLVTAGGKLALLADQMAYHHLAQGTAAGKHWLATF